MDTPHFLEDPASETEMESVDLFAKGKTVKEVSALRGLKESTIVGHCKSIRYKYHANSTQEALMRMIALGHLRRKKTIEGLPKDWLRFVRR